MKSLPLKVLFAAVIFYAGAWIAHYIAKIPPPPSNFTPMTDGLDPWSFWDCLSLALLLLAVGSTIAVIKLLRPRQVIPRKQKQLDL